VSEDIGPRVVAALGEPAARELLEVVLIASWEESAKRQALPE
jgi:hypothetical protein